MTLNKQLRITKAYYGLNTSEVEFFDYKSDQL